MTRQCKREAWLDALRILASFLVIVNHTNSLVFKEHSQPGQAVWWLSIGLYYISKIAVPLFVMVSGACLLSRQESWRRALGRFGRVLAALLVFSYLYFLHDCWVNYGLWPRMLRLDLVLWDVWTQQVSDGFWYLYFYLGLMLMLPLLQRLAASMRDRDYGWMLGLCLWLDCVFPLLSHYLPGLALPGYLQAPLYTGYLGLFFAGYWIRARMTATPRKQAVICLIASLLISMLLTYAEAFRASGKYWFMDDRLHPSLFTCAASLCVMALFKGMHPGLKGCHVLAQLGGCAFGVYLMQDWLIAQTRTRLFAPLIPVIGAFTAALVWALAAFALALTAAWVMRRIPILRRII